MQMFVFYAGSMVYQQPLDLSKFTWFRLLWILGIISQSACITFLFSVTPRNFMVSNLVR